jgi:two-component system, chemotaxis family, sensor kinase CheA
VTSRKLIELFSQESQERLNEVVGSVLDLERSDLAPDARSSLWSQTLRILHGLKGGAMVVPELSGLGSLLHAAEGFLGQADSEAPLPPEVAGTLLAALDAVRAGVEAILSGATPLDHQAHIAALGGAAPGHGADADPIEPAPSGAASELPTTAAGDGVRVSVTDLEELTRSLGEVGICRGAHHSRLEDVEDLLARLSLAQRTGTEDTELLLQETRSRLERLQRELHKDGHRLSRATQDAVDCAARLRMLPFGTLAELLRRAHRDLVQRTGKDSVLRLEGTSVAMDKRALDELRPALLHLVRNACDHGLETPEERRLVGKPERGTIRVSAERDADRVLVMVEDDGRGVLVERARERAAAAGARDVQALPLVDLLAMPGVSTRAEADEISGRGVGMGAIREVVEGLGGRLELSTRAGAGIRVKLSLPSALAARRGLLVEVSDRAFFLPSPNVARIMHRRDQQLTPSGGQLLVESAGVSAPLVALAEVLGLRSQDPSKDEFLVLLTSEAGSVALAVEGVLGQQDIVVQPLGHPIRRLVLVEGIVAHSDGRAVPVLDPVQLVRGRRCAPQGPRPTRAPIRTPRALVVDDSVTTRTLERNVLEGAGIEVVVANDGHEALVLLQSGERFDIVITDVEMPRMGGVALVREVRRTRSREELPIILVTSVVADALRVEGMEAGANALILKQSFDPERLLSAITALLPGGWSPVG